jgi:hypothetical protein
METKGRIAMGKLDITTTRPPLSESAEALRKGGKIVGKRLRTNGGAK